MRRDCYGEWVIISPLRWVWCMLRGYHRHVRDDQDTFWCRDCNTYLGGV